MLKCVYITWNHVLLAKSLFAFLDSGCIREDYLLTGSNPVPDEYITASTALHAVTDGRLHNVDGAGAGDIGAWMATTEDYTALTAYIQVGIGPVV